MKALVTGATGFIGRHMTAELRRRGWVVARCDLTLGWDALDLFREHHVVYDLVVHAAASSPHRAAIDTEPAHAARNHQLDAAMFEWAARTGQGRVLYLSSSAAYPVDLQRPPAPPQRLGEDAILPGWVREPDAAYGWAKLTGERLAAAARAAGLPVTVVRPFSGYGEDQADVFPFRAIVERARRRENPLVLWGDGRQVRDWIHVDDVIGGALAVVASDTAEPVNLCTGVGTSMLDLAGMACGEVGYQPTITPLSDKPAGVPHRVGVPDRMLTYYAPTVSLAEGVKRALAEDPR